MNLEQALDIKNCLVWSGAVNVRVLEELLQQAYDKNISPTKLISYKVCRRIDTSNPGHPAHKIVQEEKSVDALRKLYHELKDKEFDPSSSRSPYNTFIDPSSGESFL